MSGHATLRWFVWRAFLGFTLALVTGVGAIAYQDACQGKFLGYLQPGQQTAQQDTAHGTGTALDR